VRASATSKAASPASYHAPQAKADAHKADEASPFALLVDSVAPKGPAKDTAQNPTKTAMKDSSADTAQDKDAAPDEPAANTPSLVSAPPAQAAKPGKTDKNKDDAAKAGADAPEPGQDVAAVLPQLPQQALFAQATPPVVLAPPPAAPDTDNDTDIATDNAADDLSIKAASQEKPQAHAPLPAAASFGQDIAKAASDFKAGPKPTAKATPSADAKDPKGPKSSSPATAQSKPAAAAQPPAAQIDDSDEGTEPVAPPVDSTQAISTAPASGAPNPAPVAVAQAAIGSGAGDADQDVNDTQTPDASKSHASATGVRNAAPQSAAARAVLTNPGQSEASKTDSVKNGLAKIRAGQADTKITSGSEKSDTPQSDTAKSAAAQADAAPAPPKSAAPPAPPVMAVADSIAAPQTPATQAATVTQHVQVTAHAAPDLPALAVEIAAKSQSGAKQFDIRLDPPELGRVEVRLSIDATGKASAHLSADQPQTLSLLQKDATILTRALRDAGLDVSQNGLNFSLRQQQGDNAGGHEGNTGRRGSSRNFALSASLTTDAATGSAAYRGPANGRLDIRV
jgi:hypothetical protein